MAQAQGAMEAIEAANKSEEKAEEECPEEEEKKVAGNGALLGPVPSFKEESYHVGDLKDAERKALEELKLKVEECIRAGTFTRPPKLKEADLVEKSEQKKASEVERRIEEAAMEAVFEEKEALVEDLYLWRVPLLHSNADQRTDVILLKFLRARDFKVNDALSMLINAFTWRKEFSADKLLEEKFDNEFDSVAYMHGFDKEGHPVCYNNFGLFKNKELYHAIVEDESKFVNFLRWRMQVLEKGIKQLDFKPGGVSSMLQITDLKDSPGFLKWRNITKKAVTILQDNYPELVAKQVFINVPWYFSFLYSRFGQIITQRQKSKVVVARPGKVTETLFKYISAEHVPVKYGGFSRPHDTEFEGVEAPAKEVIIKAGEKKRVEIHVTDCGATVVWDVAVIGWGVIYGEEFVPNAENGYTVIIQKSKKMGALEGAVRNSFSVTEPGKVVLIVDNCASRKKRYAVHRYTIKKS